MAYLTADEFRERVFVRDLTRILADLDADEQTAFIEQAIADASAELDSYVGGRYSLSLVADNQVKRITAQLADFIIQQRRGHNFSDRDQKREEMLRQQLRDISARKAHLTGQAGNQTADNLTSVRETSPSARTTGRKRKFTRKKMEGM